MNIPIPLKGRDYTATDDFKVSGNVISLEDAARCVAEIVEYGTVFADREALVFKLQLR
jgi:hypothetical protein